MKNCAECKVDQKEEDFYKSPNSKDGLRHVCKECDKRIVAQNRQLRNERKKLEEVNAEDLVQQIEDGSFVVDQKWLLKELVTQYKGDKVRDKLKALQLIAQISGYKEDDADERSIIASVRESLKNGTTEENAS